MELPIQSPDFGRGGASSYSLETKNLSYTFPSSSHEFSWLLNKKTEERFILKDVNCGAKPGEITAIAGPSGAGKTTLLEILAGIISSKRVSGHVLVNGCTMNAQRFCKLSGYVTQDDALFPLLTVEETLLYSALLRLPGEKKRAIERVRVLIKELGLDQVSNSKIGEGSNHGISGGEKRRVSIGVELVHDPAVIFIDEPTSGLDSSSALQVILLLKQMAVIQGKTIVLTIHQPGFRILEMLDRLVLISNGAVVHNGSIKNLEERLKSTGYGIPYRVNVLEFAIEVTASLFMHTSEQATQVFENQIVPFEQSETRQNCRFNTSSIFNSSVEKSPSYSNSCFKEVMILGQRSCKNILRTNELFRTRIIQSLVAGFTLGTIFINKCNTLGGLALQTRLGFFAFTLTFLLSSTTEGLPIFLQERRIFMRETSTGAYRVSSYVIANTIIFLPFLLMVGLLYTAPVYWLVGLRRSADGYLYFTLVVWMVVLMSNSFTSCFSALVPNYIMGNSIISGLMGSFFLFSGYFITKENIPSYWIFMHYLSLFKYPFECFLINEYGGQGVNTCLEGGEEECQLYGNQFLREQGLQEHQKWTNLLVMLAFIISYRLLCFLILWCKCYRSKS